MEDLKLLQKTENEILGPILAKVECPQCLGQPQQGGGNYGPWRYTIVQMCTACGGRGFDLVEIPRDILADIKSRER